MSQSNHIKWGILSTATVNSVVIPPIRDFEHSVLHGIASRDEIKAAAYAKEHGFNKSYSSYQALLNDPEIDAVYISLPNGLHFEWIMKALECGKHILCEKSITTREDQVRKIKEVAQKKKLWVMEGFMYRYHPFFQKILEYSTFDYIGDIQNIQVSRSIRQTNPHDIRLQPELGPGVMGDVGCYCLNFCRTIINAEPLSWDAHVRYNEDGVDMEASIQLVFAPQKTSQIFSSFTTNGSFASITGTKGCLSIVEPFWATEGEREFLYIPDDKRPQEKVRVTSNKTGYALEIEDFTMAILEDRPPYLSLNDSIGNLRILQAVVGNL